MKQQHDVARGVNQVSNQPLLGSGGGPAAADLDQGRSALLRRVSITGTSGAIVIAVMGLMGYIPELALLGSVREGYIPMAPTTAISFILLGGILLSITLRSLSGTTCLFIGFLAALVSLFGVLEVAGHFTGRDLNFEDVFVPSAGYLGEIPIARMSYTTEKV